MPLNSIREHFLKVPRQCLGEVFDILHLFDGEFSFAGDEGGEVDRADDLSVDRDGCTDIGLEVHLAIGPVLLKLTDFAHFIVADGLARIDDGPAEGVFELEAIPGFEEGDVGNCAEYAIIVCNDL